MHFYRIRLHSVAALLAILLLILLPGCSSNSGGKTPAPASGGLLRIGVIPYDAPNKIETQYTPFADYLGKKVGEPAKVFVAQDYIGVVEALQADQIDCAYLNPLSYVLATQTMRNTPERLVPIAMPEVHGSLYYYGVIVTRKDTGITNVAGLKGKKFAFCEANSTSGYLYPYVYLRDHGVDPKKDLGKSLNTGTAAVIPALLNHTVDAGSVFEEGLKLFATPDQQKQFVVLARVGPIANGMLVARGNLDPATLSKLQAAMAQIDADPAAKPALTQLQVAKWDKADDSVFDPVRKAATVLGLNLQSLDTKKH